ncbi:MAG: hypothetical protein Q9215_004739 [Flavoplaca cf. flavocitrina]
MAHTPLQQVFQASLQQRAMIQQLRQPISDHLFERAIFHVGIPEEEVQDNGMFVLVEVIGKGGCYHAFATSRNTVDPKCCLSHVMPSEILVRLPEPFTGIWTVGAKMFVVVARLGEPFLDLGPNMRRLGE